MNILFILTLLFTPIFASVYVSDVGCSNIKSEPACMSNRYQICAWCDTNNLCGTYNPCNDSFNDGKTNYYCANITLSDIQASCNGTRDATLGFGFLLMSAMLIIACYMVCSKYFRCTELNNSERVFSIMVSIYLIIGSLCLITGSIFWIMLEVSHNTSQTYYMTSVCLFYILPIGSLLLLVVVGVLSFIFLIAGLLIGCGFTHVQKLVECMSRNMLCHCNSCTCTRHLCIKIKIFIKRCAIKMAKICGRSEPDINFGNDYDNDIL